MSRPLLHDSDDPAPISRRKQQHMEIATSAAAVSAKTAGWEDVVLVPSSVPETSLRDIDLATDLMGQRLRAPIVIAAMTGGHADATRINATLGAAAERLGLAVGVGSQRAALLHGSLERTFSAVRDRAPTAMVLANIGALQLVAQDDAPPLGLDQLRRAVEMVGAQALAVHLNVIEEIVQPEGNDTTDGVLEALARVCCAIDVPVIAKETGGGMSGESAALLERTGVGAIDVGGAGGTSFARIEAIRASRSGDHRRVRLGETFGEWGLPTAISVLECRSIGVPMIATGGIRNGLDAAKALSLGATAVGIGRVALQAALQGLDCLLDELEAFIEELKVALLLTGARTPDELRRTAPVLGGATYAWARQRSLL